MCRRVGVNFTSFSFIVLMHLSLSNIYMYNDALN